MEDRPPRATGQGDRPETRPDDATAPHDVNGLPDAVLARRAGMGDRPAFAALVHRHGPALFLYALTMLDGDRHDAEDAAQSAWAKAWQNIDGFRGEAALRTWLFRIMANEVHNSRRRRRPVAVDDQLLEPLPSPAELGPEHQVGARELRVALEAALHELPWRQRAAWVLREIEGLSYAEIANILDTSPTVVRGQLHRARSTVAVRMVQWR